MKAFFKTVFFAALELLQVNRAFRNKNRGKIKVLLYHNVCDHSNIPEYTKADRFSEQLRYLRKHYNLVHMSESGEWVGLVHDKINVLITFDDGFINNYETAFPLLRRENVRAMFFLIPRCLVSGTAPYFSKKYENASAAELKTVTVDQAQEMSQSGMSIGCHGLAHEDFRMLSIETAMATANESQRTIERLVGRNIKTFAFPWGYFLDEQLPCVLNVFRRVFSVRHGFNSPEDNLLNRNEVSTSFQMYAATSGSLDWFKSRFRI